MAKKIDLVASATKHMRAPRPSRLQEPKKKGYRVIAVSLYTPEADWIEETISALKRAGNPKATRSLVVREAVLRMQESLKDKTPQEILSGFTEREARRAGQ